MGSSGLKKRVTLLWALHLNLQLTSVALEKHGVSSITKGAGPSYLFKMPLAVHYDLVGHTIVRTTGADPKSRCLSLLLFLPVTLAGSPRGLRHPSPRAWLLSPQFSSHQQHTLLLHNTYSVTIKHTEQTWDTVPQSYQLSMHTPDSPLQGFWNLLPPTSSASAPLAAQYPRPLVQFPHSVCALCDVGAVSPTHSPPAACLEPSTSSVAQLLFMFLK